MVFLRRLRCEVPGVKEHREDSVISKNIRIVIRISGDRHCRRSGCLLERYTREGDGILILRQLKQHVTHLVGTLYNVSQTIETRVVEYVADYVGVYDSAKLVVHERPSIYADQGLNRRAQVIRGEVRSVGKLDVDQAIDCNCRVCGKLDKGVEGEG